jgi:hypothetical protein
VDAVPDNLSDVDLFTHMFTHLVKDEGLFRYYIERIRDVRLHRMQQAQLHHRDAPQRPVTVRPSLGAPTGSLGASATQHRQGSATDGTVGLGLAPPMGGLRRQVTISDTAAPVGDLVPPMLRRQLT